MRPYEGWREDYATGGRNLPHFGFLPLRTALLITVVLEAFAISHLKNLSVNVTVTAEMCSAGAGIDSSPLLPN